jgi:hypothetical protein
MPRRVRLPGASELFRPTHAPDFQPPDSQPGEAPPEPTAQPSRAARGTGRVRHDEKITVYVSSDELVALEQARLTLRAEHGMAVDRGRIVREAIAALLDDLQAEGASSELVRRLSSP